MWPVQSRRTRQSELVVCDPSASDPLGKARASLMLIYGEFETFARISESFGLLINGDSIASVSYALKTLPFMVGE